MSMMLSVKQPQESLLACFLISEAPPMATNIKAISYHACMIEEAK